MFVTKCIVYHQRKIFITLLVICLAFVTVQFRFNYISTIYCSGHIKTQRAVYGTDENVVKPGIAAVDDFTKPKDHDTTQSPSTKNLRECEPKKYVLFLKTHKTGSSTITNILNRYADKNNMSILLPKGSAYYSFDWPNKFRLSFSVNAFSRANFLANHARYSRKSMNVLFPRETTTYISVLRHPVSQWESTFQYMSFPYILDISNKNDPLDFFLNNPPSAEKIMEIARRYPSLYLIRNPLFFDLGLDYRYYDNATFIKRALKTLDDDFDLVLIMEHFDESLTLLRRRLCWEIDDVVYFKMNERLNRHKRRVLSEIQIEKIKLWNNADVVLYNFFVERFWKEVKNEGPGFYDDVVELRKRRTHYSNLCIEREAIEEAYSSVYVKGYKIRSNLTGESKTFCQRMLKNELHYMDYFRGKRVNWLNKLEGVSIQNFENSRKEVEIYVETSDIKTSNYKYGRPKPTKKLPKPTREVSQLFDTNRNHTNRLRNNNLKIEQRYFKHSVETNVPNYTGLNYTSRNPAIMNGINSGNADRKNSGDKDGSELSSVIDKSGDNKTTKRKRKKKIKSKKFSKTQNIVDELKTDSPLSTAPIDPENSILEPTENESYYDNLTPDQLKYDGKTIVGVMTR